MGKSFSAQISLAAENIEGEWNRPILENASALFGTECRYFSDGQIAAGAGETIFACETGPRTADALLFKAPPGAKLLLVGNETDGLSSSAMSKCKNVISLPVVGRDMESLNVGVAACLAMYCLSSKLPDPPRKTSTQPDVLLNSPADPYELGSVLRTLWCFGWKKIYLLDSHDLWFDAEPSTRTAVLEASRGIKNHTHILPAEKILARRFDHVIHLCSNSGRPLSRLNRLPDGRTLLILSDREGDCSAPEIDAKQKSEFYTDFPDRKIEPRFRLDASTALMMIYRCTR